MASRLLQFSSPLGKDVLLIESIEGAEGISRLFEYHVELLAAVATTIDPKALVGNRVTAGIVLNDVQGTRWINGIVASFEQCAGDMEFNIYRARIVPALWQLTLVANCRVFQNKSVMDIVKSVIGDYGLSISDKTSKIYKPLDYCTQYSESDFHFVSRLLEENGIFYWFDHTDQDHTIVFADGRTAYAECPVSATIPFALNTKGEEGSYGSFVTEISSTATMVTGKHSTYDFDFRPYNRIEAAMQASASPYGKNGFEQYHYPAGVEGYFKQVTVQGVADMETLFLSGNAEASDAVAEVYSGGANARSFCAGFTFTLDKHPRGALNRKYLLTSVSMRAGQSPSWRSEAGVEYAYSNTFSAVSSDIVFQPPRTAVKPRIFGPQTAKVVAPGGEDMYIDKYGRVCVQFFWDRTRSPNTIDNTWVRVAQNWAGNGWGIYFWPRIDDEVVVQFLNGDPDNPVVAGSVYNGVNMPKYALPDHSTRSGLYTRSSKGGSAANANELRFEDKKGSEQIFLNAEMDMDHRTEHDHRRWVGNNDSLFVKENQTEQVGGDVNREIKGNQVEKVDGKLDLGVSSDITAKTDGNLSVKVGSNHAEKTGMNYSLDAGMEAYIKAGMSIVIEAGMELTLKAAGGFINIGPAGVAISGTMVLINSGGAAGSGSAGTVNDPATPNAPDIADDGTKGGAM
jgi:type VI secretion system secreted protein VgrG